MRHVSRFADNIKYFVHDALANKRIPPKELARKIALSLVWEKNTEDAPEIAGFLKNNNIKNLIHFTHIENLEKVLKFGLIPRLFLEDFDLIRVALSPKFVGARRLEGETVANSLSLSFPDYEMFSKISKGDEENWAVILFNLNPIVRHKCYYKSEEFSKMTSGIQGLKEMFADLEKRVELQLEDPVPTNPIAEIFEYSVITPSWIEEIHLFTDKYYEWATLCGDPHKIKVSVKPEFFSHRKDHKSWPLTKIYMEYGESIQGKNHLNSLKTAIQDAKYTLFILSGWISIHVLTEILSLLQEAIRRGVNIFIGYGCEFRGEHHETEEASQALEKLGELGEQTINKKGELHVKKFANHEKIILVDDKYIICGSNNWLSNNAFSNSEFSIKYSLRPFVIDQQDRIKKLFN